MESSDAMSGARHVTHATVGQLEPQHTSATASNSLPPLVLVVPLLPPRLLGAARLGLALLDEGVAKGPELVALGEVLALDLLAEALLVLLRLLWRGGGRGGSAGGRGRQAGSEQPLSLPPHLLVVVVGATLALRLDVEALVKGRALVGVGQDVEGLGDALQWRRRPSISPPHAPSPPRLTTSPLEPQRLSPCAPGRPTSSWRPRGRGGA